MDLYVNAPAPPPPKQLQEGEPWTGVPSMGLFTSKVKLFSDMECTEQVWRVVWRFVGVGGGVEGCVWRVALRRPHRM